MTNWKDIHPNFTPKLQKEWEKWDFTREQTKEWLDIGLLPKDAEYAQWLRDVIHETPKNIADYGNGDGQFLQEEYNDFISLYYAEEKEKKEVNVLKEESEKKAINTVQAQKWLDEEYPIDGKCLGLVDKENKGKKRKEITKLSINKKELVGTLNFGGFTNLKELIIDTSYEEPLDLEGHEGNFHKGNIIGIDLTEIPKLKKLDCSDNSITNLNLVNNKELTVLICYGNSLSDLDVNNLNKLEELKCGSNKLTNLNLSKNINLARLYLGTNYLSSIDFLNQLPNPKKLTHFAIGENNFPPGDLAIFEKFINLEELCVWVDNFNGSLKHLEKLTKLKELNIDDTNIDSGLEYLPKSLKTFTCARCPKIEALLEKDESNEPLPIWKSEWRRVWKRKELAVELEEKELRQTIDKIHATILRQLSTNESKRSINKDELERKIREKLNTNEKIVGMHFFSPWWNPNCVIVISHKNSEYTSHLIIYEPTDKKMPEIFKIIKVLESKSEEEINSKIKTLKEELDSDCPLLVIAKKGSFSLTDFIERTELEPTTNPDDYLKPLDIVWRKIGGNKILPAAYHAAIYLDNKQVVHISAYSLFVSKLKECQNKLQNKEISREEHETDDWLQDQIDKLKQVLEKEKEQEEKNIDFVEREDTEARINTWEYFLKKSREKIIRYHPIIPFKKLKKIMEHITKAVFSQYAREEYNLITNNCQHFATLCVCGIPFSEQINRFKSLTGKFDKLNLIEEINKTDEMFERVSLKKILLWEVEEALTNSISNSKGLDFAESREQLFTLIHFYKQAKRNGRENEKWLKNIKERLGKELSREEVNSLCQTYRKLVEIEEKLSNSSENKQEEQRLKSHIEIVSNDK